MIPESVLPTWHCQRLKAFWIIWRGSVNIAFPKTSRQERERERLNEMCSILVTADLLPWIWYIRHLVNSTEDAYAVQPVYYTGNQEQRFAYGFEIGKTPKSTAPALGKHLIELVQLFMRFKSRSSVDISLTPSVSIFVLQTFEIQLNRKTHF